MKLTLNYSLALLVTVVLYSCSLNNVSEEKSLGAYFDSSKVSGCFAIYNNGTGQFTVYNLSSFRDSAYSPASTFNIVNSLIALHTGKIFDENEVIQWDGQIRLFPNGDTAKEWNRDLDMKEAFKVSSVPYYQEVARRIGADTMKKWIDSIAYGNKNVSGPVDSFWFNNRLKIKSDEQLGLMKKLYFHQLPFSERAQRIVYSMMLQEDNALYKLYYKTGFTHRENGNQLAWITGWIEENKHPYFFVLNLESADSGTRLTTTRNELLKKLLLQLGFMKGLK